MKHLLSLLFLFPLLGYSQEGKMIDSVIDITATLSGKKFSKLIFYCNLNSVSDTTTTHIISNKTIARVKVHYTTLPTGSSLGVTSATICLCINNVPFVYSANAKDDVEPNVTESIWLKEGDTISAFRIYEDYAPDVSILLNILEFKK